MKADDTTVSPKSAGSPSATGGRRTTAKNATRPGVFTLKRPEIKRSTMKRPGSVHPLGTNAPVAADVGTGGRIAYAMLHPLVLLLGRIYFRFEVVGADKLPPTAPYVLAPVHRSGLDFILAAMVTRRRVRWMAKSNLWNYPFLGWFVQTLGAFKVQRGTADRRALHTGQAALRHGQPVIVFPEGTRQKGDTLEHLFDGAAWLACHERVPLVPLGIAGSDEAMPKGAKFVRPRKILVVVGEPMWPDVAVDGRVRRHEVTATTERLRPQIQAAYDQARALAGRKPASVDREHGAAA